MKHSFVLTTVLLFLLTLAFLGCSKSDEQEEVESVCLTEMMNEFKERNEGRGFTFISMFELDGKTYYIFDDGTAFDGTASVVDKDCEVLCFYGGFRNNTDKPCTDYWDAINGAVQIWPEG